MKIVIYGSSLILFQQESGREFRMSSILHTKKWKVTVKSDQNLLSHFGTEKKLDMP